MDNKVTKERISNHLEYDWIKYLLLIAVAVALVVFTFSQINSDRDDEKFTIFIAGYGLKTIDSTGTDYNKYDFSFNIKTKSTAPDYDESKYGKNILRTVIVDGISMLDENYSTLLQTRGFISSNALVLGLGSLQDYGEDNKLTNPPKFSTAKSFLEMTPEILELLGVEDGEFELLRLDENGLRVDSGGAVYGIRVDYNNNPIGLSNLDKISYMNYIKEEDDETVYEEQFYLFINKSSKNLGSYTKKKKTSNYQTLFCVKEFLEIYR